MKAAAGAEEMTLHRPAIKSEHNHTLIVVRRRLVHNQNLQADDCVVCILRALC